MIEAMADIEADPDVERALRDAEEALGQLKLEIVSAGPDYPDTFTARMQLPIAPTRMDIVKVTAPC